MPYNNALQLSSVEVECHPDMVGRCVTVQCRLKPADADNLSLIFHMKVFECLPYISNK